MPRQDGFAARRVTRKDASHGKLFALGISALASLVHPDRVDRFFDDRGARRAQPRKHRPPNPPIPRPANPDAPPEAAAAETPVVKYDLQYKFTPGETLRTEIIHRATVQTTIQGSSQTAETQSTSIKAWKVDSVSPEGTVQFIHMIESIDMWQRTQGRKEIRYNSADGGEVPPGYEEVAKAVGVPLSNVTMSNRGTIIKRRETNAQPLATSTQMTMPFPRNR